MEALTGLATTKQKIILLLLIIKSTNGKDPIFLKTSNWAEPVILARSEIVKIRRPILWASSIYNINGSL